jgi:O-antigen/teichoic acid export membrane protein
MDKKKVAKNSIWLSGGQFIGRIIGFVYFIFLARNLPVNDFGIYSWVLGLSYNFYPLADFGIQRYVLKHLSRDLSKSKQFLSKLLPLRFVLAVGSLLLSSLLALILGSPTKAGFVALFGLSLIPFNLIYLYTAIKNSAEEMQVYSIATIGAVTAYSLIGAIMIQLGLGLPWLFLAYFLGNLIVLIGLLLQSRKLNLDTKWDWDPDFCKKVLNESWAFAFLQVIAVFYLRLSLVLVGSILGDYQAGIYGTASKFIEAGILLPQSIAIAFFPSFSKIYTENKKRLKRIYFKTLPLLALIGLVTAAAMWLIGPYLIPLVFGPEYQPAVPIFQLMGVLMFFFFINSLAGNIIQNSPKVKQFLPLRLINFLVALIAGLILIPKQGAIGGVWAMIIGEIYGLLINNFYVLKILNNDQQ